jgi:hypothetical protein
LLCSIQPLCLCDLMQHSSTFWPNSLRATIIAARNKTRTLFQRKYSVKLFFKRAFRLKSNHPKEFLRPQKNLLQLPDSARTQTDNKRGQTSFHSSIYERPKSNFGRTQRWIKNMISGIDRPETPAVKSG